MDNYQNNYNNPYEAPQANNYYQAEQPAQTNSYYQPVQSQPTAPQRVPVATKVLSGVSMGTGIFGLIFCWYPLGIFGIFSIAALVTNSIGKNKANGLIIGKFGGMAKAGKITGIIGVILNAIGLIIWCFLIALGEAASYV